jgi:molybdate transport system regulatory protein
MNDLHPNCKLWIYSDSRGGVFGDGKLRLLQEIERQGSLTEAAAALGISYRKAWGDLRKAEECLQKQLIERFRGGRGGGQTTLTGDGRELVKRYSQFQEAMQAQMAELYHRFLRGLLQ